MSATALQDPSSQVSRGRRPIADGIIRIGPCMAIPALLRGLSVDPALVMADAGITVAVAASMGANAAYYAVNVDITPQRADARPVSAKVLASREEEAGCRRDAPGGLSA